MKSHGMEFYYESFGTIIVFFASLALAWGIVKAQDKLGWNILR